MVRQKERESSVAVAVSSTDGRRGRVDRVALLYAAFIAFILSVIGREKSKSNRERKKEAASVKS